MKMETEIDKMEISIANLHRIQQERDEAKS